MAKRRQLTRPPTQPGGLALDDPFVRSLGVSFLVYGGLNWDFASNRPLQSLSTLPVARAETLDLSANNSGAYRLATPEEKTQSFTMGIRVRMTSGNTNYCPLMGLMYDQAGNVPYGTQIDLVDGRVRFAHSFNGTPLSTNPGSDGISSTEFEWIWVTLRTGNQAVYKNSNLIQYSSNSGIVNYTATSAVGLGSINADGRTPGIEVNCAIYVPRELSTDEMNTVMANHYRLARNPQRRPTLRRGLLGPTYTLALNAASFALSGSAARVTAARRLAAATAGYSMTGIAAALVAARKMTSLPGVISLAGSAAALKVGRRLAGSSGAMATGVNAAEMVVTRKLTAAPGAFALTGGAASFVYTPKSGGQGPTYTLTGGSGAFLLAVTTSRMLMARRMAAAAGAFSATGMPARVAAARRLPAKAASFNAVGGSAGLLATRCLRVGFATFNVTAPGVRLLVTRRLPGAAGAFAVAGVDASIKYSAAGGRIDIDAAKIPASRFVIFGGGSRTVVFGGFTRVVVFGGGTRVVVFDDPLIEKANSMANAEEPYFVDGKWFCDKDPDEKSYFVADIAIELAKRGTTAVSVEVIPGGVTVTEGPDIQGHLIVVKLEGWGDDGADNFWTARVTCANTERFDRTTWLNRVDN
jgi:hypothetical protein